MYDEIDVTSWRPGGTEQMGTKPKQWLFDPEGHRWLWKQATENTRSDGTRYAKGDDWSERIACAVAGELGVPAAVVELAVDDRPDGLVNGIISRNVLSGNESLILGNTLLAEIGVAGSSARDRTGYTPGAVRRSLTSVDPPLEGELTAWDWWVGYLVLDALIGNTDRHQENWAVVGDGRRRLAPTFDHASSLGFQLDDDQRSERLGTGDQNRTVAAYAARAVTKFEDSPHPCDAAIAALADASEVARAHWKDRLDGIIGIEHLTDQLPTHRASVPARSFANELFAENLARLVSQAVGTL